MKTNKKKFIFFLLAGLMLSSCGKNNSSGGDNWGIGGDYQVIGSGNSQATENSRKAFNAAVDWFNRIDGNGSGNGEKRLVSVNPYYGGSPSIGFVRLETQGQMGTNPNCQTKDWWIFEYTTCSGSSNQNVQGTQTYHCTFSNPQNQNYSNAIGYKKVDSPDKCQTTNGATTYKKEMNDDLRKVLSLNGNKWALHYASNNGGVIQIHVGPKRDTNEYWTPTGNATHVYVIDTNVHSVYNPISVQDLTTNTSKYIHQIF